MYKADFTSAITLIPVCNRCHGPLIDHIESKLSEIVSVRSCMYVYVCMCMYVNVNPESRENKIEGERREEDRAKKVANVK